MRIAMMRRVFGILVLGATATSMVPADAWSHSRLKVNGSLPPRSTSSGIKAGPCGGLAKTTPTQLVAGQKLVVEWEETIEHPGWYRIAFSPSGDTGFDQNVLADNIPDTQGGTLPHAYSKEITIPNTPCTNCAIQLIQVMTNTNPPSNYYSCADIVINASGTPAAPAPSASPASADASCE